MSLRGKKIIVGVTGSIAAYKSALLIRALITEGAEVQVVMTKGAEAFITPLTMATLSKRPCLTGFITEDGNDWNNHVHLGLWGDALVIAPATANTLSKMANGLCDNLLMGVYLSARCPVFIAPAMDEDMWRHPSTQGNIQKLKEYGNTLLPVNEGSLASGLNGPGRMSEPHEIVEFLDLALDSAADSSLKGKKVVITAGPTFEPIDPVRFIGNHSSGKMGIALAEEADRRGAIVQLILGPSQYRPSSPGIQLQLVKTGEDMLQACEAHFGEADLCIFAAAVADYAPKEKAPQKLKKSNGPLHLELHKTTDIALSFGNRKRKDQVSVGFALETEAEMNNAQEKLKKKNFDLIVLNSLNDEGAGFQYNTNKITLIDKDNNVQKFELKSKALVAADILDKVETLL